MQYESPTSFPKLLSSGDFEVLVNMIVKYWYASGTLGTVTMITANELGGSSVVHKSVNIDD